MYVGAGERTFKVDHVATADSDTRCVCRCAAPHLRDFSPCGELADRARFVADDEPQNGDDAPRVRPTTHRHLVWPVDFEHGEQQARLAPRGGERRKRAERKLEAGEPCDRRRVGESVVRVGGVLVAFLRLEVIILPC